ncbi:unnamed protein product [Cuscuta epithymum]|uniref:BHLH domain-containing protein n=1 Tax=Cuscuta epithymum TaxID=186058 RepID=A0AAV0CIN2_9ASTE|nr:unnamed protein product [Cuscuta epithymum]
MHTIIKKDHFLNGGGAPPPLHFEPTKMHELNSSWGCSQDHQYAQFELPVSSMATTNSAVPGGFAISELIGELSNMCSSTSTFAAPYVHNDDNNVNNNSSLGDSLKSPPKLHVPSLGNSPPLNPAVSDRAEMAAKFSCLGNRSFNGRTGQFGLKNGKVTRVLSSPSLKQSGIESRPEFKPEPPFFPGSGNHSNAELSVSDQPLSGSAEFNPRKRKTASGRKSEEDGKGIEGDSCSNAKQSKLTEVSRGGYNDCNGVQAEDELNGNNNQKSSDNVGNGKPNQKLSDPPKDYIHVRARRGQATDSHSLAERVRREKISERMKLLQDLVPGCNKVTGKALMLDEIINYVQSLQRQVEFLSMKLATVNPRADCNAANLLPKEICQPNVALPLPLMYPLDSPASAFHQYAHSQVPQLNMSIPSGAVSQCPPIFSIDASPNCSLAMQFPPIDAFTENLTQCPLAFEDDLQSIVKMGFS